MAEPVIVEAVRTPIGKRGGFLSGVIAPKLLAVAQQEVIRRVGIQPSEVDQLVGGCVTQGGQQASNVTRNAWLTTGVDFSPAATTIDCQCGSGAQANTFVQGLIATGGANIAIGCGVEQMSQVPLGTAARGGGGYYKDSDSWPWDDPPNGQFGAAQRVAERRGITREQLDQVGVDSQKKAAVAWEQGRFDQEIVPVIKAPIIDREGEPTGESHDVTRDQGLRETTIESLAKLSPVIEGELHTAGTSSQISDGASAVLWMDREIAESRGIKPRAKISYHTMVGSDPYYLLDGPVDATQKMLDQTNYTISDFDLFECNEAFASVMLSWAQVHEVPLEKVNVNGGAIALGHPVGCTGSRLITTLLHELERQDKELGFVTMCQGGSLGIAIVLERL
ncbi:MAG: steroid 3-ketoacyl-CoA thiolase [Acidimicrobiales bacterium]|nr:steroid 3-ketoacyl-CoA thiolase [Acidimicrobiales bacterium]MDP6298314.1 steroid 3-ketoacyl-CoA thiolase [Acidimicrobiales bacterium]HJM28130.1 steroid 3-ketoacyl-CoA thiolase [Acidimicrobiales bacterium]HJM96567.1 steroid 3-ketoacyl-CoA thiolase [Acidimicrobiales bacterium]